MNNDHIQTDRYLQNEMSAAERTEFENHLATDTALQEAFKVQQQLVQAITTAGIKNEFGKAIRRRIIRRQLLRWGIAVFIVAAGVVFYGVKNNWFSHHHETATEVNAAIPSPERFEINTSADTVIETKEGVVFGIPANAFAGSRGTVQLEIKTALDAYSIMQQGLSTISNGELLQTAGMFYINGYENGQPLLLQKEIAVSVPARNINPAMQLFEGVQDSNGIVNWVNPRPVEKKLRTVDITTLDFYPADYISTLKALQKNYRDKRYTDSLYYSFSGYHTFIKKDTAKVVEAIGKEEETLPPGNGPYTPVMDYADGLEQHSDSLVQMAEDSVSYDHGYYEIDPARIKAIWNKKFNNTILATKEFEERLRFLHTLCDPRYLKFYIQGLNKPMYEIDQLCANNSSGKIKDKFLEFAARKDGRVIIAEGIQEKLNNYFQQKTRAWQEAAAATRAKYQVELDRLDNIADAKRREESIKEFVRENNNFKEEFCINLTASYKQIEVKRSCNDTIPAKFYNISISTTGWKNLDVYVFEATRDRQSMSYTDPVTGKTATLTYSDITIAVEEAAQFDKVLVYLIPDSLSSFQRMKQQGNVFTEKLNSLFRYDAVVLAYKGTEAYYYRQQSLQATSYTFTLSGVSQEGLAAVLKMYSINRGTELKTEFAYQLFEQQEIIRQVQVRKDQAFREQVAAAIFKCLEGDRQAVYDAMKQLQAK